MRKFVLWLLLLPGVLITGYVQAQKITVQASIDSTQLWIGQQTLMTFEVSQQPGQLVLTPLFSDTIIDGIELVEPVKSDTTQTADGHLLVRQQYLVTAFTDSLYLIPAFPFVSEGEDTVWSNPLSLKVIQPFEIDTASNSITDIKDVAAPKFSWKYFFRQALPWMIGLLVLAAIIWLLIRLLRKKPVLPMSQPVKVIPPHELALGKLQQLKDEKLWQQNRQKEYHTALTDILREYLELSFDIPAPELTSDELLTHLSFLRKENKNAYTALQQILQLADLVKFAKWYALPEENELSYGHAIEFINLTKTEEKEDNGIS
ncbi:MAG: hypothetical protein PHU68_03920 [Paludibacter sp.]|nr:hypothetical protein [Paludibacter sp.]